MGIITTVNSATPKKKVYPYLGINEESGQIILFLKPQAGVTIVKGKNAFTNNGEYFESWLENNFVVFEGEVILKNES